MGEGWRTVHKGWTVHDVVARLIDTARTTRLGLVAGLAWARFDLDLQNARGVERHRGASPHARLERLRRVTSRRSTPPAPLDSRLVEHVVHGEDIRRPLGLTRSTRRRPLPGRAPCWCARRPPSAARRSWWRASG